MILILNKVNLSGDVRTMIEGLKVIDALFIFNNLPTTKLSIITGISLNNTKSVVETLNNLDIVRESVLSSKHSEWELTEFGLKLYLDLARKDYDTFKIRITDYPDYIKEKYESIYNIVREKPTSFNEIKKKVSLRQRELELFVYLLYYREAIKKDFFIDTIKFYVKEERNLDDLLG